MEEISVKRTVISLGGSILVRGSKDAEFLSMIAAIIRGSSEDMALAIITGGGRTAREYIGIGRTCGADEATLDEIGIAATRLNAFLLVSALKGHCYPRPFLSIDEGLAALGSFRIAVGGGTHPGHTTDAVAALLAERWGADLLLNLTSVDGAYTADPEKDPSAKRIERMTSTELVELVDGAGRSAGSHSVMDPLAAQVLHRAKIPTCILHGRDLESVRSCLRGGHFKGTIVEPDRGDRYNG
jgi:uridylate kinase